MEPGATGSIELKEGCDITMEICLLYTSDAADE